MTSHPEKKIIIIAGPNGAGKTTFAEEFLPKEAGCSTFVNADLIAAGLAPFEPERAVFRAGRLMLEEIYNHARRGESFAFETNPERPGICRADLRLADAGLYRQAVFSPACFSGSRHYPRPAAGARGRPQHPRACHSTAFRVRAAQFREPL
jgi:hypothetical protein